VREDEGVVGFAVVVVDSIEGVELGRSETCGGVCAGAEEGVVVEVAHVGVCDDAVDEAVSGVALSEDFGLYEGEEGCGNGGGVGPVGIGIDLSQPCCPGYPRQC